MSEAWQEWESPEGLCQTSFYPGALLLWVGDAFGLASAEMWLRPRPEAVSSAVSHVGVPEAGSKPQRALVAPPAATETQDECGELASGSGGLLD